MKTREICHISLGLALVLAAGLCEKAWAQEEQGTEAASPPAPPRPNAKALRMLRLRFEREPSVEQVQSAALRFFQVHTAQIRAYLRDAALKALIPDLEVGLNAERGHNDRRLIDALYEKVFRFKEDENNNHTTYSLNLRAHWALDRLLFNAEVLDVTSLVGVQEGLLREITSLYFTRRRLMTFLTLSPPQDPGEKITESIRLDEITANINALTGGYYGRELRKRLGMER